MLKYIFGTYLVIGALFGVAQGVVDYPVTLLSGCLTWQEAFGGGYGPHELAMMYMWKMIWWAPDLYAVVTTDNWGFLEWLAPRYVEKCG
ncbi:hypothetical protein [Tabrizicola sp.]|uniref:hypothetical protein n=1 Tax=Tabrizicola sp. TaxID=2005166 RepID=UPI003F305585